MELDALTLSRIQFGLTTAFHIMFPTMTIGTALFLAFLEGAWLKTGNQVYRRLYHYWVRLFALAFGIGVVSGVVLTFEFGLNWSGYSNFIGDVLGPLIGYEVLTAFFLEAGFIGIMLFGERRVGPKLHFFATCMVALGTTFSAFWILAANSWMQTPAGYELSAQGYAVPVDWMAVIFNPSFPYRLAHMVNASLVSSAFVIAAVSAWCVLKNVERETMMKSLKLALLMAAITAPLQAFLGDQHGLNTLEYQPIKIAAIEGHWETVTEAPLVLFAWPDMDEAKNFYEVSIPYLGSLILTHSLDGTLIGLDTVPAEDRPYVPLVFFAFRIMAGLGFLMIGMAFLGQWLRHKKRLDTSQWYLKLLIMTGPAGIVATIAGWITTEAGRQPWVVYEVLRTKDAVTPSLDATTVAISLIAVSVVYLVILYVFLKVGSRMAAQGPQPAGGAV
jgi:cytochrome d ubiquinol oxidase subunit I